MINLNWTFRQPFMQQRVVNEIHQFDSVLSGLALPHTIYFKPVCRF